MFPKTRMRRLRVPILNDMIQDVNLSINDLIYPIFVDENIYKKEEIESMPGVFRWSLNELNDMVLELIDIGIKAIILFGIPISKDENGSSSYDSSGIIQKSISKLKRDEKIKNKILIIADLCLCEYTTHGHCGILSYDSDKTIIDNDKTLDILNKIALSYAKSGVDIIAPSGMMDGAVQSLRSALDKNNYSYVSLMPYSIKYNSCLYGPFRSAADSGFSFGDRSSYQMNYSNSKEFMQEIELDILEGADFVIIKPGIFYLDILHEACIKYSVPLVSYQVSGEYSMIKAASMYGYIDEKKAFYESLIAFKRAGASMIITYYAKEMAKYLTESKKV